MLMIENYIPEGYLNRVSRSALHEELNLPDRIIRKMIEEAQDRGSLIVSYNGGYFRRKDEKDDPYIMAYMGQENRRFKTMSHKNKRLREAWGKIHPATKKEAYPGQISIFDYEGVTE